MLYVKRMAEKLLALTGRAKIFVLAFSGVLVFVLQTYGFPEAGKTKEDHSGIYSFQSNVWANEIVRGFQRIGEEGLYQRVSITQSREVSSEFIQDVLRYHSRMQQIMLFMHFQWQGTRHIFIEMEPMLLAQKGIMPKAKRDEMNAHMGALTSVAEDLEQRVAKLDKLLPRLLAAYDVKPDPTRTESAKVAIAAEQIKTLMLLLSDRRLTPALGSDHLDFVKAADTAHANIAKDYTYLVEGHNKKATTDETLKNLLTLLIYSLGAYLAFAADLKKLQLSGAAA